MTDPKVMDLADYIAAKCLLRSNLMYVNKGVDRIYNFSVLCAEKNEKFVLGFAVASILVTAVSTGYTLEDFDAIVRPDFVNPIRTLRSWARRSRPRPSRSSTARIDPRWSRGCAP